MRSATLLLAALTGSAALAQPCAVPSFGPPSRLAETDPKSKPDVLVADLDGDRIPDILMWLPARSAFFHGRGDGKFVQKTNPLPAGLHPLSATDLDGDGKVDVLAEGPAAFVELLGDGHGTFRAGSSYTKPDGLTAVGNVVDFDHDGQRELVVGVRGKLLLLGSGGQPPRDLGTVTVPGYSTIPHIVRLTDIDRDGLLDAVVSVDIFFGGQLLFLHGTPTRAFEPSVSLTSSHYGWPAFEIADFDGDGKQDIAALPTSRVGANLEIFRFVAGTSFARSAPGGPGGPGGFLALAELNGDNHVDIVTSSIRYLAVSYLGDGTGSFQSVFVPSLPGIRPYNYNDALVAVADLNGDGRADLVLVGPDGLFVQIDNCSQGVFSRTLVATAVAQVAGPGTSTFTSKLRFFNAGTTTGHFDLQFVPSIGSGPVTSDCDMPGGWIATEYGPCSTFVPYPLFPENSFIGIVRARASQLSSSSAAGLLVRTEATVDGPSGKKTYGTSYMAVAPGDAFSGTSYVAWLKEDGEDRTNLAVLNAGNAQEVVLRVTVVSTDPDHPGTAVFPDVILAPSGFLQINRVLEKSGLSARSGWAKVERVSGSGPYFAYAVLNDAGTSDGSFLAAVPEGRAVGETRLVLPVLVKTSAFSSELVLTNVSSSAKSLRCRWVPTIPGGASAPAPFNLDVAAGQQIDWPNAAEAIRALAPGSLPPPGTSLAGALFVDAVDGDVEGLLVGARTTTRDDLGRYGVFMPASSGKDLSTDRVAVFGLEESVAQDPPWDVTARTNLAVVNAGATPAGFRLEFFDAEGGPLVELDLPELAPGAFRQLNAPLAPVAGVFGVTGWARITRTSGEGPFLAYGVRNDGLFPGQGSGDATWLPMVPLPPR